MPCYMHRLNAAHKLNLQQCDCVSEPGAGQMQEFQTETLACSPVRLGSSLLFMLQAQLSSACDLDFVRLLF